ncbi:MAG: right-handed parallel beta-helix repeat-containing protein [Myxococcota bacterium]|nr:right-handed parallel beta-helix repeat-containing protein [Myxococcota bacterium]
MKTLLVLALLSAPATAGVVNVSTPAELATAIGAAAPGDEIVLAAGTYRLNGASCAAAGTEAHPIIVRAATPLAAIVELDGVEGFRVTGAHWHFEGLDVRGVCASDPTCEHAFHVSGAAHGFVLRGSRVVDFNAQLKVNASMVGGTMVAPDRGLIEYNEVGDTRGRNTSNPVTKLNIDTGDDWVVRGNYLHDAQKIMGDGVSYAAFLKSGGKRGVFERNLVLCSRVTTGGTRIGLSLGGGGTGPQFCAPAYDANVPCSVEHDGGVIRNNIIANCSDVGIYLNRAKDTRVLYNTLIGTAGIDFRFATTTGEAVGNLLTGMIRPRDGGTVTASANMSSIAVTTFTSWYRAPLTGDLATVGDVRGLVGAGPARADVPNDYCAVLRPAGMATLGAIEHSVGTCDTTRPPVGPDPVGGDDAPSGDDAGGGGGGGGDSGGCCQAQPTPDWLALVLVLCVVMRRPRSRARVATAGRGPL